MDSLRHPLARLIAARGSHARDDAGITLVEVLVTMTITAIVVALLPSIFETTTGSTSLTNSISAGSAQARLGLENLSSEIGSATQICLPTSLTTTGPTVTAGFAVRVETLAYGHTEWAQWMLNTSTGQLQEQQWPTTWTSSNPVPPWVTVANSLVNPQTSPPFSLPTSSAGSPQSLSVSLEVRSGSGRSQIVVFQSTIAALNTPYSTSSTCSSTED